MSASRRITIILDEGTSQRLDNEAQQSGQTINGLASQLLNEGLDLRERMHRDLMDALLEADE